MAEYRVNLDIYNGPMDLLLYLIRREEVDIYDIPIARVTEQYVKYVEVLHQIDPNLAGEFLVMAATLMEIKTRMLLPTPPPEEGRAEGLAIDPRAELVRQLLEYKAFKDAASDLASAAEVQNLKFPRQANLPGLEDAIDLEDAQVWDLLDAFSRLLAATGRALRQEEVIYDDTPVELHAADIIDRLQREGPLTFRQVFEGRMLRTEIVGLFLALLELVRQKKVFAAQEGNFREIHIHLNPSPPAQSEVEAPAVSEVDGPAPSEVDGPAPSEVDGPAQSEVDGPAQSEVEAPAPSEVEAPAPSEVEGPVGQQESTRSPASAQDQGSSQGTGSSLAGSQLPGEPGQYISESTPGAGKGPSETNPEQDDDDGGTATQEPGT